MFKFKHCQNNLLQKILYKTLILTSLNLHPFYSSFFSLYLFPFSFFFSIFSHFYKHFQERGICHCIKIGIWLWPCVKNCFFHTNSNQTCMLKLKSDILILYFQLVLGTKIKYSYCTYTYATTQAVLLTLDTLYMYIIYILSQNTIRNVNVFLWKNRSRRSIPQTARPSQILYEFDQSDICKYLKCHISVGFDMTFICRICFFVHLVRIKFGNLIGALPTQEKFHIL